MFKSRYTFKYRNKLLGYENNSIHEQEYIGGLSGEYFCRIVVCLSGIVPSSRRFLLPPPRDWEIPRIFKKSEKLSTSGRQRTRMTIQYYSPAIGARFLAFLACSRDDDLSYSRLSTLSRSGAARWRRATGQYIVGDASPAAVPSVSSGRREREREIEERWRVGESAGRRGG